MRWVCFKNATYMMGFTYISWWIFSRNMAISQELLFWDRLYALIAFECAVAIYPVWVIGMIAIISDWKKELSYARQEEDSVSSSSS